MNTNSALVFAIAVFAVINAARASTADDTLMIVRDGQSEYVIEYTPDANGQSSLAATELHRVIKLSTGADLRTSAAPSDAPAIRLLADSDLPPDGFEIRIEGRDVVIAGNDLQSVDKPDRWFLPSHGTFYGVYEFLERFVGVRWLMPGEIGEDIPVNQQLIVSLDGAVRGQPSFAYRTLMYVGEGVDTMPNALRGEIKQWMSRHRLTNARHEHLIGYGHSWDDYILPSDMESHPQWHASDGPAVRGGRVKYFCTTAPGLVETFAARLIDRLDRNSVDWGAPISPTDGGDFCRCSRCRKMLTEDPHGNSNHAQAILTFYRQVAELVLRERPGRRLGGFAYYNYQYPPPSPPKLPENFSLSWTPLNYYGYGLLKPVFRDEFADTMKRWSRVSSHLCYHNYSTWMRSFHGAPLPVSIDILNLELPTAAEHGAWGASMVGSSAWGVNAPINYILAKQMWNADIDPGETLDDWLSRAYGPGWRSMRMIYDDLEKRMKQHKASESPAYKGSQYEVNELVMTKIYSPMMADMEQRFRSAFASCQTERQRMRLRMFGNNLVQLHYALRKAGLISEPFDSIFYRDDQAFALFLKAMDGDLSLYRDNRGIDQGPIWKGEWQSP